MVPNDRAAVFLAEPRIGVLAVAAAGRAPLAVPVWYALNADGEPWFVTPKDSPKSRLIEKAGRITLTSQRETRPYAYVSVEGPANLETAGFDDIRIMASRYLGEADGVAYADRMREAMEAGTRWRVTLSPERWSDYGLSD